MFVGTPIPTHLAIAYLDMPLFNAELVTRDGQLIVIKLCLKLGLHCHPGVIAMKLVMSGLAKYFLSQRRLP